MIKVAEMRDKEAENIVYSGFWSGGAVLFSDWLIEERRLKQVRCMALFSEIWSSFLVTANSSLVTSWVEGWDGRESLTRNPLRLLKEFRKLGNSQYL